MDMVALSRSLSHLIKPLKANILDLKFGLQRWPAIERNKKWNKM